MAKQQGFDGQQESTMGKKPIDLPPDIVYEILLFLPVKKLIMLKCVCTDWYSLISSAIFQQDHFHRRSQQKPLFLTAEFHYHYCTLYLHLLTYSDNRKICINKLCVPYSISFPHTVPPITIKSCRGLICITESYPDFVLVCNPSTGEALALPSPLLPPESGCFGFGYTDSTNEFKVVAFGEGYCKVFTLGADEGWREAKSPPPYYHNQGLAPFVHGALHLLPQKYDPQRREYNVGITAFDILSEEYRGIQIPLPQFQFPLAMGGLFASISLLEFGGSLYLTSGDAKWEGKLGLWMLKDYQNAEWVKVHDIFLSSLDLSSTVNLIPPQRLAIMDSGNILLRLRPLGGTDPAHVVSFHLKDKVLTHEIEEDFKNICSAGFYVESFLPLRSFAEFDMSGNYFKSH